MIPLVAKREATITQVSGNKQDGLTESEDSGRNEADI